MARIRLGRFPKDIESLRKELRPFLPEDAFKPQPSLMVDYALVWATNVALVLLVLSGESLALRIAGSIALGLSSTYTLFFTHIFIHGQVLRSIFWQRLLGWPCVYFGLISPAFWSHWHHLHHRFGTLDENVSGFQTINWIRSNWLKVLVRKIRPSQDEGGSFLYLLFWKPIAFSMNQIFVFIDTRFPRHIRRPIVFAELAGLLAIHAAIWWFCSWDTILLLEVVPWFIQNFISSAYVVTNHHPMLIVQRLTFHNTCTVHLNSRLLDAAVLNIGYHIEHHIFPECPPKYLPQISELLSRRYPNEYRRVHLFVALRAIFWPPKNVDLRQFENNSKI